MALTGGPRTGKTTLAGLVTDRPVIATDDYREIVPWADIPHAIIADAEYRRTYLLEGVQVARALRKGLAVDAVVYLTTTKTRELKRGHLAMAKGVRTVFDEWHKSNLHVPVFFEELKDLKEKR